MEIELLTQTGLDNYSEEVKKEILRLIGCGIHDQVECIREKVDKIQGLMKYISFLEGIFLPEGKHFTADEFSMPGLRSLLKTENRGDEKEKREVLEFFREQFRGLYPDLFTLGKFKTLYGYDNPASILVEAKYGKWCIDILRKFYLDKEIKELNLSDLEIIQLFNLNGDILRIQLEIISSIFEILGIENKCEKAITYLGSKFFSFSIDDAYIHVMKPIELFLKELKKIDGFNFEGIFDIDVYSFRKRGEYGYLFDLIKHLGIKDIKVLADEDFANAIKDFKYDVKQIIKLETLLGRKLTVEEIIKGGLTVFSEILEDYGGEVMMFIHLSFNFIFEYFETSGVEFCSENSDKLQNLFTFISNLSDELKLPKIEAFYKAMSDCEKTIGFKLTFECFEFENNAIMFAQIINELYIYNLDNKKDESNLDPEKYKYLRFFKKFTKFIFKETEDSKKYEENWNIEDFKKDNGVSMILLKPYLLEFIHIFLDEFDDYGDIVRNPNFEIFYLRFNDTEKNNTIRFIKFIRKYNLFDIKLSDINDDDFLSFIQQNFTDYSISNYLPIFPEGFFEGKINSYNDFKDQMMIFLISEKSLLFGNLSYICKLYNIPITLSGFRSILDQIEDKEAPNMNFLKEEGLNWKIHFILGNYKKGFGKDLDLKTLFQVICKPTNELEEIEYENSSVKDTELASQDEDEKLDFLVDTFCKSEKDKVKFYRDLFSGKDGNLVLNRDKRILLKMVFDRNVEIGSLRNFLGDFEGFTLGKLVDFYLAGGLNYTTYNSRKYIKFFIIYSLEKNKYTYLEHNIEVCEGIEYEYDEILNFDLKKLRIILDKTEGFLTKTFVEKFDFGDCSEKELYEMIADYKRLKNILTTGGTLDGEKDPHGLIKIVIAEVYPEREYSANVDYYADKSIHLERYNFERNGYHIDLTGGTTYILRGVLNADIKDIHHNIMDILEVITRSKEELKNYLSKKASENDIKLETSSLESQIIEYYKKLEIKFILTGKRLETLDLLILIAYGLTGNYNSLNRSYYSGENKDLSKIETMMLEFGDKFKETIKSLLKGISIEDKQKILHLGNTSNSKRNNQISKAITRIYKYCENVPVGKLTIKSLKTQISNNLKAFFDENTLESILNKLENYIDINSLGTKENFNQIMASCIEKNTEIDFSTLITEGNRYYAKLEKELKKFEKQVEEGGNGKKRKLDVYFMKTKESSRARGVAGNCAGTHSEMWDKENYFELVLFDSDLEECIGVVELLVMDDKKGKYLLYGPTPRETYLNKVDSEELYNKITQVIIGFARDNGFDGILTNTINGMVGNVTGKFAEVFQRSVLPGRISLEKNYNLFGGYNFKDNLEIVWQK